MNLGRKKIGEGKPAYIIAEIGINHNGDFDLAHKLINAAKDCGVDCVKFQKRNLEQIYHPEVLENPHLHSIGLGVYIPILRKCEFTREQHGELKAYAEMQGLDYLCTPFDVQSAEEIEGIGVHSYKVGSIDLKNFHLLQKLVSFKKPIIISTGMSSWEDILEVNEFLKNSGVEYAFMHCVSTYPVDFKDCNLKMLDKLKELRIPVGYSGHERGVEISVCAVAMGASIVERHFTFDRTMVGPDHAASLEPTGLKKMVEHIRAFELARGDGVKRITRGEQIVRESLGRNPLDKGTSALPNLE